MIKKLLTIMVLSPTTVLGLQALNESELSDVTGEGIGATFDNVVLYSGDLGQPDDFEVKLYLDEGDPEKSNFIRFSELRLNKTGSGNVGSATGGGRFGTYLDPFNLGSLVDVTEDFSDGSGRTFSALKTAFPGADLRAPDRNFISFSRGLTGMGYLPPPLPNGPNQQAPIQERWARHGSLPANTFYAPVVDNSSGEKRFTSDFLNYDPNSNSPVPDGLRVNSGEWQSMVSSRAAYDSAVAAFESDLDIATDKFDLRLRVDSVTDQNRNAGFDEQFFASLELEGMRLYGTETFIWARDVSEFGNNSGLAVAATTGLVADSVSINADPNGALSSRLSLDGVDAYLPLGTVNQPLTISTVRFQQQERYNWVTEPALLSNGDPNPNAGERVESSLLDPTTQLRIEITALPQLGVQADQGNITVRQLSFGDPNDPEIITGVEDVYLRNSSGDIVAKVDDVTHRAFVPRTVTYNEEVKNYNDTHGTNLPYIPNENVIEIRGIEIQRMVITTQDLNRVCTTCITQ